MNKKMPALKRVFPPGQKGFAIAGIFAAVTLISLAVVICVPGYSGARLSAQKKVCGNNMVKIFDACEEYERRPAVPGSLKAAAPDIKQLVAGGFLNEEPACPASGKGEYCVKFESAGRAPKTFDISCRIHGDLSKQNSEHSKMGAVIQYHPLVNGLIWFGMGWLCFAVIYYPCLAIYCALSAAGLFRKKEEK